MSELPAISDVEIQNLNVYGARVHNLKNIDVSIPRNKMVVITGISGSGKSSLAFDTIYAEGQRRYIESFSAYARQFMGGTERPDVDKITGLSPVISIEQKTTNKNPRSTVGTITEVYDFMRLLFARTGEAFSYSTGKPMVRFSEKQILTYIVNTFREQKIIILAPLVRSRKGHYRELFEKVRKQGYLKVRIDGELEELTPKMQVDRYKVHDIEVVVDRVAVNKKSLERINQSLQAALKMGNDRLLIMEHETKKVHQFSKKLMDPETGISYEDPSPNSFSFNSPYGACPTCKGLGVVHRIDDSILIADKKLSINEGGLAPLGEVKDNWTFKQMRKIASQYNFTLATPIKKIPANALNVILYGQEEKPEENGVWNDIANRDYYNREFDGLRNMLIRCYKDTSSDNLRRWAETYMIKAECPTCRGQRLKQEYLHFKIAGKNIAELARYDIAGLKEWFEKLPPKLAERQLSIGKDVIKEIGYRLEFLVNIGLGYLSLSRPSRTLSGGESQRIRLATQIGSQLVGITYILDEPSIGLHQRDNERLTDSLKELTQAGNTVIVVEHDKQIMEASDYVIDLGPGAGFHGGEIVGEGTPADFIAADTLTSRYLKQEKEIEVPEKRREGTGKFLTLKEATGHNLKKVDVSFPLGKIICVTGVSGSGKSSLINETLYPILRQHLYRSNKKPLAYKSIKGIELIDKVIEIDQSPIGRTPRSNPATYIGVFTDIRALFSGLPEAKIRGYKPGRFSFNVKSGRCEVCEGGGMKVIEMNFLPDVYVQCEKCMGKRFNRETLEIRYKGKSISDVLEMPIEVAVQFFESIPKIHRKLKTLCEVGLGYITLGQSATTVSGGEAQRVKLASELCKKDTGSTFYILDEPTTGLHFEDIRMLLKVLYRLADKGNTVLIIEHNLDVIKVADHIIDLGPEGGERGGQVLCEGTPEEIVKCKESYTARFLGEEV